MKPEHIQIRIEQCLSLAKASHCPRRKLAAMLIDPKRNVVLADGYNGGPRGAPGTLCKGHWCERDGLKREDIEIKEGVQHQYRQYGGSEQISVIRVFIRGNMVETFHRDGLEHLTESIEFGPLNFTDVPDDPKSPLNDLSGKVIPAKFIPSTMERAEAWVTELIEANPPIKSGTMMERGCCHAEMNVICNAAAGGVSCTGAWMIVLAEPCKMCAKMIHHSGVSKVILVDGGYVGGKAGVEYLRENGVEVEEVEGPKDPRFAG